MKKPEIDPLSEAGPDWATIDRLYAEAPPAKAPERKTWRPDPAGGLA